jgi:hypothetical protein
MEPAAGEHDAGSDPETPGRMYPFAISGHPMKLEKRKAVFKDIQAMQEAADVAHGWLVADPGNPPPWTRSLHLPWQLP